MSARLLVMIPICAEAGQTKMIWVHRSTQPKSGTRKTSWEVTVVEAILTTKPAEC